MAPPAGNKSNASTDQNQVPQGPQGPHPWRRQGRILAELRRVCAKSARPETRGSARRAVTRHLKRVGRVWIRVFPDVPISRKPAEVRMGSGKGTPEYWVCRIH